jgi:hypothetical protein
MSARSIFNKNTMKRVNDTTDKLVCIKEVIRDLKSIRKFVVFDLFLDRNFYPPIDDIKKEIELNGGVLTEMKKLDKIINLTFPLKNKKVLGNGLMIIGTKKLQNLF